MNSRQPFYNGNCSNRLGISKSDSPNPKGSSGWAFRVPYGTYSYRELGLQERFVSYRNEQPEKALKPPHDELTHFSLCVIQALTARNARVDSV